VRTELIVSRIVAGAMGVLSAGCSVVGIRTYELASYQLVLKDHAFELRRYGSAVVAETEVAAAYDNATSIASKRLADYIFGSNLPYANLEAEPSSRDRIGRKIAMTGPVLQDITSRGWRMAFYMPSAYPLRSLPAPADSPVSLRELPERNVASVRFTGHYSETSFQRQSARLEDWIVRQGLEPASSPRLAGYDRPWTLPRFRRNEGLIDVR
jgi:hypothetical protein